MSESQFKQVLNIEFEQILQVLLLYILNVFPESFVLRFLKICIILWIHFDFQACKALDESWSPKFTIVIAQKQHHTKFFQQGSPDNVPPG